jgi:hypothetical protein
MKLFVCYGTFGAGGGHACGKAYAALRDAGHDPQVIRSYGSGFLPDFLNLTPGRRQVKRLTGKTWVPVLITDDGEVISDSKRIVEWAKAHPKRA